jgi:hypothetical protein
VEAGGARRDPRIIPGAILESCKLLQLVAPMSPDPMGPDSVGPGFLISSL